MAQLLFLFSLTFWGFHAHKLINQQAVYSLPPEMRPFFLLHQEELRELAVNPDKRRFAVKGEAEKHFIDLEAFGDSATYKLPRSWTAAKDSVGENYLRKNGILPWNLYLTQLRLVEAFKGGDPKVILRLAADIGHYIGDAHVPLHTTKNYNGQYTNQYGIHGFWETRLPELFSAEYNFFVGTANYLPNFREKIWEVVRESHALLPMTLDMERELSKRFQKKGKYSYEERAGRTEKTYSFAFSQAYHQAIEGMIEDRMRQAIKLTADAWYSAWIEAGQPLLDP
ncbi:MAG: zinc dependent phospholipase C family protein [Nitritalea sp.]